MENHPLQWTEELSVQVKEIDEQHKKLLGIFFSLFEAINKHKTKEELSGILKELIAYSSYHFATEEKYFHKFKYEFADEHIKQHQTFREKMLEFEKNMKTKKWRCLLS